MSLEYLHFHLYFLGKELSGKTTIIKILRKDKGYEEGSILPHIRQSAIVESCTVRLNDPGVVLYIQVIPGIFYKNIKNNIEYYVVFCRKNDTNILGTIDDIMKIVGKKPVGIAITFCDNREYPPKELIEELKRRYRVPVVTSGLLVKNGKTYIPIGIREKWINFLKEIAEEIGRREYEKLISQY